jgi:preprotein translocase subunit SecD
MSTNDDNTAPHIVAPTFLAPLSQPTQQAVSTRGTPSTLNLDDIFGDCFFTPEGDQIFLSESQNDTEQTTNTAMDVNVQTSGEAVVSTNASKPVIAASGAQQYVPVPYAGGIATTGLNNTGPTRASTMGPAPSNGPEQKIVPMAAPPQQRHHLQYALVDTARRKSPATSRDRKMSDQQKSERRYVFSSLIGFLKHFFRFFVRCTMQRDHCQL